MENETDGLSAADFHAQPGVDDWRVTSWGPQACFRTSSLQEAARLTEAVVSAATRIGLDPDIDVRAEAVVVRIPRNEWVIPGEAARLAAAVSESARELGIRADPGLIQTVDIFVAQHVDVDTRPFWMAALGYVALGDTDAVDPLRRGPALACNSVMEIAGRGRTHVDLHVPADQAEARVAAALAAGGRLVDDSRAPMWWTVASPDNHGVDIAGWTDTDS
jgi:4a-hydroxytetrahydrobiopterin dehydratase